MVAMVATLAMCIESMKLDVECTFIKSSLVSRPSPSLGMRLYQSYQFLYQSLYNPAINPSIYIGVKSKLRMGELRIVCSKLTRSV